jgi:hypothetical protein
LIYVQTENWARTYVAYGDSEPLDRKTAVSPVSPITGQPYWSHFHRLTGLQPEKAYHYRMVCRGTNGEEVVDRIREFRTTRYTDAVAVPGDLPGPPFVLDRSNSTYVMTEDIAIFETSRRRQCEAHGERAMKKMRKRTHDLRRRCLPQVCGAIALLICVASQSVADDAGIRVEKFTYKKVGDLEVKADLHRADDEVIRPVVVWIHGGALIVGHRGGEPSSPNDGA